VQDYFYFAQDDVTLRTSDSCTAC